MSKKTPSQEYDEKASQEYAEKLAEDPSQFYDDEPEESKAAAKAAVNAAAGKVAKEAVPTAKKAADAKVAAAQAKRFQAALAEKAAKDAAQKEIDNITENMNPDHKGRLLAAMGVVASPLSSLPRVKYDHEATLKLLVKTTAPVRAVMEKVMDDYESVVYMGALCDYWKSRITQDRAQINGHAAFKKYFKKVQHLHGLPERGVTEAFGDISFDEDEEAGAGAGAK